MHLVQQPLEELEGVVLLGALVLGPVPLHRLLEGGAQLRAVLAGPEGLQHQRELLGHLAPRAELLRVELVPPAQVLLVPGERRGGLGEEGVAGFMLFWSSILRIAPL